MNAPEADRSSAVGPEEAPEALNPDPPADAVELADVADVDCDADCDAAVEALMDTSRVITAVVARTLGSLRDPVSVPQLRVLVMLHFAGPMNLTGVADGLGVNPSNASRTCEKLAAAGLVERKDDPHDRRHLSISLTAKGRRRVDALMHARRKVLAQMVAGMRPVDQRRLSRGLDAFLAAAEESGSTAAHGAILHWMR